MKNKKTIISLAISLLLLIPVTSGAYKAWYDTAVKSIEKKGIMIGDSSGFRPDNNVTRAELAQVFENSDNRISALSDKVLHRVVKVIDGNKFGTGLVLDSVKILTCAHVVDANTVNVKTQEKKSFQATVLKKDINKDLCLLSVVLDIDVSPLDFSEEIKYGERVFTIGHPFGYNWSLTDGIVSNPLQAIDGFRMIQFNSSINGGNSGGALFNMKGEVVGIVARKVNEQNAEGMAFAIPSKDIIEFLEK